MEKFRFKKILITGGCGFIGTNFVRTILSNYPSAEVLVLDLLTYAGNFNNIKNLVNSKNMSFIQCDICDNDKVTDIFDHFSPDCVVNFAAESHVDRSILNSKKFVETNILGTHTLLGACKWIWDEFDENDVRYLQVSTDEVYGSSEKDFFNEKTSLDPHSPYAASKASADLLVKSYVDTYDFPAIITRCSNNYGPYQFPEKLIPLMINNIVSGKKLPIYGDGKNVRDWIYVNDHCSAIIDVLQHSDVGEIYNIGSNNEWSNINLVKKLIKIVSEEIEKNDVFQQILKVYPNKINEDLIEFVSDRPGHDQRYAIDNTKIKTQIGWEPKISFEEGLKDTVHWYLSNYRWIENIVSGEYKKYYEEMYA